MAAPALADAPMESLRWYLEDYLRTPLGAYGERGPQIARQLPDWGARVFSALFGTGPGRDAYLRARGRGGGLEIVLRSGSAQLLALPWELMTDPERPVPLVLDDVVLSRRTPGTEDGGSPAPGPPGPGCGYCWSSPPPTTRPAPTTGPSLRRCCGSCARNTPRSNPPSSAHRRRTGWPRCCTRPGRRAGRSTSSTSTGPVRPTCRPRSPSRWWS